MARGFTHPRIEDITLNEILHALADPVRRNVVQKLMSGEVLNCSNTCSKLSPSTVSFHYKILREAGLVYSEKKGVEVLNTLRSNDVNARFPGLLDAILNCSKNAP
ncbi:MAG: transcriptional regulator [Micavibrio aeruginosavorus]|uniref:Transcriptional regulator n=1 Tax=Micavibrio aeruginosavorus TaxID=349221 RepID=A0A2W5N8M3_9BACT|nr:MAG: transcriptional regulator [Micavibrio aeruginosavorus]